MAASVLLFAGCQNEIDENAAVNPSVFTATIDGDEPATRTLLGAATTAGRDVLWKDGDELIVGGKTYRAGSLTDEGRTATLSPKVATELAQKNAADKYEAYYPTSIYNGGSRALPAVQYYELPTSADGNRVVAAHLPMYAESATTNLNFKNLCAVLNFQLKGTDKVTKVVVTSATKALWGPFDVTNDAAKISSSLDANAANRTVTLNCGTSGVLLNATTPTEFCIAVPAADYPQNDLTVEVFGTGSTTTPITTFKNAAAAGSQLERSKIYNIGKQATAAVFSVMYNGVTTSSTGTTADGADITCDFLGELLFSVTTTMGYEVTVSNPSYVSGTLPTGTGSLTDAAATINITHLGGALPAASQFQSDAKFSVGANQQVSFSPGNLQYQASTGTWRFAEHQYDYVGNETDGTVYDGGSKSNNANISPTYSGWIDLFGWGTSGKNYGAVAYQPYSTSESPESYGFLPPENLSMSRQSDWGVNDIYDGITLVPGRTYRTLTLEEFDYLLDRRDGYRFMRVRINTTFSPRTFYVTFTALDNSSYSVRYKVTQSSAPRTAGIILFPDNFEAQYASLVSLHSSAINQNIPYATSYEVLTPAELSALEAVGCVYLPGAGVRTGSSVTGASIYNTVCYWTGSQGSSMTRNVPWYLSTPSVTTNQYPHFKSYQADKGYAVRLVKDVTTPHLGETISPNGTGWYGGSTGQTNGYVTVPIGFDATGQAYLTRGWADGTITYVPDRTGNYGYYNVSNVPDDAYVVWSLPWWKELGVPGADLDWTSPQKAGIAVAITINSVVVNSFTEKNGTVHSINQTYSATSSVGYKAMCLIEPQDNIDEGGGAVELICQNASGMPEGNGPILWSLNGTSFHLSFTLSPANLWKDCTADMTITFTHKGTQYTIEHAKASYYYNVSAWDGWTGYWYYNAR